MSIQPDPFGAPAEPAEGPSGPRAGFWQRFAAALIDGLLLTIVFLPLGAALDPGPYYVVATLVGIAYYTLLEGGPKGQTVGKMALGIRVVDIAGGGSIGQGRTFVRYLGRIVSALPLLLGYFWMLWDSQKQTWHDKFASSVVVPASSTPAG